jgi:hypothetical protein
VYICVFGYFVDLYVPCYVWNDEKGAESVMGKTGQIKHLDC